MERKSYLISFNNQNLRTYSGSIASFSPETLFCQLDSPLPDLQVSIVLPARNEAALIENTLHALYHQVDAQEHPLPRSIYEVILLANNCTDDTAAVARRFGQAHPDLQLHVVEVVLPAEKANVGTVRRMLMNEACNRLKRNLRGGGIIASTDGDTIVDRQWLYYIIREMENGVDAVGGRILTRAARSPVRHWYLQDALYRTLLAQADAILDPQEHDPWPRHFQYFGASLAVTCKAYEQAGRMPEVPFLEDNALHDALRLVDARIRRSNAVKVYTSDRLLGRAEVGFSEQLQKWSDQQQRHQVRLVEAVAASLLRSKCRYRLRRCWQQWHETGYADVCMQLKLARQLGLSFRWLQERVQTCNYFGRLWHETEAEMRRHNWGQGRPAMPIADAITELRAFVKSRTAAATKK